MTLRKQPIINVAVVGMTIGFIMMAFWSAFKVWEIGQTPAQPYYTCYHGHLYYVDADRVYWPQPNKDASGVKTCE